jgi:2-dehydro-3-deoxygluconokinase
VTGAPGTGGLVTLGETMAALSAPGVGPLRHHRHLDLHVGGAESNVAIGAVRLGGAAAWIGRVGDDELGDLVLTQLRGEGVDISGAVRDPDAPTGLMIESRRTESVSRVAYYRKGSAGSRLVPGDVPAHVVRGARVLHVTGITTALSAGARAATFAAVEEARGAGVPVSLDVNYRSALWPPEEAAAVLRELAVRADLLFAGDGETDLLGASGEPAEVAAKIAGLGPAIVVVKLGARGAVACAEGRVLDVPPRPVTAVDPVGAGDAFVAGYLAELLNGAAVEQCLATAASCGAFAVTVPGHWEGLPSRRELSLLGAERGTVVR